MHLLDGCNGVKTGYTDDAGRCLVSSCERDGMNVVCVVLSCRPMFEESALLLNQAFDEYKMFDLTKGYSYEKYLKVIEGKNQNVVIGTKEHFFYPLKEEELKDVAYVYDILKEIEAPVTKDMEVGEIQIFVHNNLQFSEKIYTMENVRRNSIWSKIKRLIEEW